MSRAATRDPILVRWLLIAVAVSFLALFLVLPLAAVLTEALRKGADAYWRALGGDDTLAS
ncbi:MAG: sulfate transport system permease, partial [Rhodospirillaceae bacterium]